MSFVKEFKEFISRGNVFDLAVGVVIGGAFGKIVDSVVKDIMMPFLGILTSGVDFSQAKIILKPEDVATKTKEIAILYGAFINNLISFIIISLAVFLMIKAVNKLKKPTEVVSAPASPTSEELLAEIRDLLKSK